jgi:hypothetical protein
VRRGVAIAFGLLLAGCTRVLPPESARPALLTNDDVLLVDRRALSIAGFLSLRQRMPQAARAEQIRVATAILALQNEWQSRGRTLGPEEAWALVRGAQGAARADLDALVARSVVQRNDRLLTSLD